ncbi:hypothetical protein KCU90_g40, partial [Aureobasidium melanogenum]
MPSPPPSLPAGSERCVAADCTVVTVVLCLWVRFLLFLKNIQNELDSSSRHVIHKTASLTDLVIVHDKPVVEVARVVCNRIRVLLWRVVLLGIPISSKSLVKLFIAFVRPHNLDFLLSDCAFVVGHLLFDTMDARLDKILDLVVSPETESPWSVCLKYVKRGAKASGRIFVAGFVSAGKIQSSSTKSSISIQVRSLSGIVNLDMSTLISSINVGRIVVRFAFFSPVAGSSKTCSRNDIILIILGVFVLVDVTDKQRREEQDLGGRSRSCGAEMAIEPTQLCRMDP